MSKYLLYYLTSDLRKFTSVYPLTPDDRIDEMSDKTSGMTLKSTIKALSPLKCGMIRLVRVRLFSYPSISINTCLYSSLVM